MFPQSSIDIRKSIYIIKNISSSSLLTNYPMSTSSACKAVLPYILNWLNPGILRYTSLYTSLFEAQNPLIRYCFFIVCFFLDSERLVIANDEPPIVLFGPFPWASEYSLNCTGQITISHSL